MEISFTLTDDQAARATLIACRDQGHAVTDCFDPDTCIRTYAGLMLSKHVEMTERQILEEEVRAQVVPFFEAADA